MSKYEPVMTIPELEAYVDEVFPESRQNHFSVEAMSPGKMTVGMEIKEWHMRPGGTVSGPAMFALADCAAYFITLAHVGKVALAVTTNLNINFLNKPVGNLVAETNLLKLGKRLAVSDVSIFTRDEGTLVAHATATYSIPVNR